jgi:starch synthase
MSDPKVTKKILYVSSEIFPYMPETDISVAGRYLPQGIQEAGKEIRAFMPRYGIVNERRNQLHEVIRLSGMNIVVDDTDRPLTIKVASISQARMQVYFIDNEDYFKRKAIYTDEAGKYFPDNDERAIFFAIGVMETVKKLRWEPDIVHCEGWISYFLPLFLKKAYNSDPIFSKTKVVLSLYNDCLDQTFPEGVERKLANCSLSGISESDVADFIPSDGINLVKLAIRYADGIVAGVPEIDPRLSSFIAERELPVMDYAPANETDTAYIEKYNSFYDQILPSDDKSR